jgi:3',5'-cyclic AMP phosphodiesterase CpdA
VESGRLSHAQIDGMRARLSPLPPRVFKVLVTHHPFVPLPGRHAGRVVGRGLQALEVAEACGVDLLLAGHLHVGYSGDVRAHHLSIRRSIWWCRRGRPRLCASAASPTPTT